MVVNLEIFFCNSSFDVYWKEGGHATMGGLDDYLIGIQCVPNFNADANSKRWVRPHARA